MKEFLDHVLLDNSVRSYLLVAATIIVAFLLKKYLSRYIAGLLFRLVKRIAKGVDKTSFVNLVVAPLQTFLLILVTLIALEKLNFPKGEYEWAGFTITPDFSIFKVKLHVLLALIGKVVLISSFIWLLIRIIDFIALILEQKANLTPDLSDNQLIIFFKDFFKVILVFNGLLLVLKFGFGFNITSLLTGLSIVGAAIALATRESLENLIASFIIFFDKPFITGDLVKVQQVTGTVERIGLRSTRIRTEQKTYVTVPNKQMVDSLLDNFSQRTQRRGLLVLELQGNTPPEKFEAFIMAARALLEKREKQLLSQSVYLSDIQKNAVIVQVDFFTPAIAIEPFNRLKQEINLELLRLLQENGIRLASKDGDQAPGL